MGELQNPRGEVSTPHMPNTEKTLQKLNARLEAGEFYEAQQVYKTLCFRYSNQGKHDVARDLLAKGCEAMNAHAHPECASELGALLVQSWLDNAPTETERPVDVLCKLVESFPETAAKEHFKFRATQQERQYWSMFDSTMPSQPGCRRCGTLVRLPTIFPAAIPLLSLLTWSRCGRRKRTSQRETCFLQDAF